MFLLKLIISTLFVLVAVNCSPIDDDKIEGEGIVGGENVGITEFPYIAQVVRYHQLICGAAIISEQWLLTAAHCVYNKVLKIAAKIVVGTNYRYEIGNGYGNVFRSKQIILHENYNSSTMDNDIALIELEGAIYLNSKEKPIQIGKKHPKEGDSIKVPGFGRTGEVLTRKLKVGVIPVVNFTQCSEEYKKAYPQIEERVTHNMFCAGKEEVNICYGDSGSPAVINGKLVGIVSWGVDCGVSKLPGVYTLVKNYREWISNHTGLTL